MEDPLKKRLVGAVVLVSLAVIFVPMLFEDEPVVSSHISETNIPPRPDFPTVDMRSESAAADTQGSTSIPGEGGGQSFALPLPESSQGSSAPVVTIPETAASETPKVATKPSSVELETKPKPAPPPPPPPIPVGKDKPSSPSGWVIQVGSFSDKSNADSTLERLRKAGYDSFMQEIKVGDKVLYRVRVGPEAERESAEKLQEKIAQGLKLQGQVQKYP